jgi:hypothetical protein
MKFKTPAINLSIIGIISIFLILTFVSCTPAVTEKIGVDTEESTQESEKISEEEINELEETAEVVDYENAQVGAEIKGYIPSFLCTDSNNYIKIEITNTSDFTWKSGGNDSVRVGYHYYGQDVDYSDYDNTTRTLLPNNVEPGESVTVEVLINDITHKGIYVVQIDLVLEGHFWFSTKDVPILQGKAYFSSCTDQNES